MADNNTNLGIPGHNTEIRCISDFLQECGINRPIITIMEEMRTRHTLRRLEELCRAGDVKRNNHSQIRSFVRDNLYFDI